MGEMIAQDSLLVTLLPQNTNTNFWPHTFGFDWRKRFRL